VKQFASCTERLRGPGRQSKKNVESKVDVVKSLIKKVDT